MKGAVIQGGILIFKDNLLRQRPSRLVLPGLTAKPWWSKKDFQKNAQHDWISELEESTDLILNEYKAAKEENDYILKTGEKKLHEGDWKWKSLIQAGKVDDEATASFAETYSLLSRIPNLMSGIPFAYSFFSTLGHEASIQPHYGASNLKIRCHLPLELPNVPKTQLGINVAGETRAWKKGELMIFDDSFIHSTWNVSYTYFSF